MNTNKLVAEAAREVFNSGAKKATHKQIAQAFLVLLLGESHAAETALMTPTVSKIIRDGLKGIQRELEKYEILVVPFSRDYHELNSVAQAYRCLPHARQPAIGLARIEDFDHDLLWEAWWKSEQSKFLAVAESREEKVRGWIQKRWITDQSVKSLRRNDFRSLIN
jgi:hypothetical protein